MASNTTVEAQPAPHDNLTQAEAAERAALISNLAYRVSLTLSDDPAAETFTSVTDLTFDARREDAATFIDLVARSVDEVELNGRRLSEAEHRFNGTRLWLPGIQRGSNRLHITAHCEYQHTGVGLHRLQDPMDKRVYVYTHFEPFDAHKVLACFDQPDLKATVEMTLVAPSNWRVCGNGAITGVESRNGLTVTRFNATPPIPSYLIAIVAGPFYVVTSEHHRLPLG
ncbi:MAG: aminopeptidase N, partial [Candidatus Dormibacteraeota bacterium]|nr:aminopeptidase N [Candidatus Dormibacteraeota bacterium]